MLSRNNEDDTIKDLIVQRRLFGQAIECILSTFQLYSVKLAVYDSQVYSDRMAPDAHFFNNTGICFAGIALDESAPHRPSHIGVVHFLGPAERDSLFWI